MIPDLPLGLNLLPAIALGHQPLGVGKRARRVEPVRAGPGAVHDGVAAIGAERVLEPIEAFAGALISAVGKPAVRLQQDRRAKIAVLVPPVARTRGRAAEAEDALPRTVELRALLLRLAPLAVRLRLIGLPPGLDQCVMRIWTAEVGYAI